MINAVAYALYDRVISGEVAKDELINITNLKKGSSMEVEVSFLKGKDLYKVRRFRGEGAGAQLFLNDVDITPAGAHNFNAVLREIIGFSFGLFSRVILFDGNSRPFLSLGVGEQRAVIEELFKITVLSQKAAHLKKLITATEREISLQMLLIQQQEKQNAERARHLADARARVTRWQLQHQTDMNEVEASLRKLNSVDFDTEEHLLTEVDKLNKMLVERRRDHQQMSTDATRKDKDLSKVKTELVHLRDAKCPYCLQKFQNAALKVTELEGTEKSLAQELFKLKDRVARALIEVGEINGLIQESRGSVSFTNLAELFKLKSSSSVLQDRLTKLLTEQNPHEEPLKALEAEGDVVIDYAELDRLKIRLTHQQFLLKLLTDKSSFIRKNIIGKTMPFLNKRIGYYTEKLNLPHITLFQPDMSCQISQYGRNLGHGNLSNGEKKRLNLALCLAFRDVLTFLHNPVNILFTDEVDGGSMDSLLVDQLIGLLKHKAWDDKIGIYVISHRPEFEGRCDRTIVVRKEQGFSQLIEQPT